MSVVSGVRTFALLVSLGLTTTGSVAAADPVLAVGEPAPPLKLVAADGTTRTLAEAGRPVVLIFFRGLW